MKYSKFIVVLILILLLADCEKDKNYFNSLILGKWQLTEIFGVKEDKTLGWIVFSDSVIQTIVFGANEDYQLATDGTTTCNGKYMFETDSTIRFKPNNCMPITESVETIHKLSPDTLIISNNSNSISSFNLRRDKYFSID